VVDGRIILVSKKRFPVIFDNHLIIMKNFPIILIIVLISMNITYTSPLYSENTTDSTKEYSDKRLGSFVENGQTYFRLFAPDAVAVLLITFSTLDDSIGVETQMIPDENGVWEIKLDGEKYGLYYGYKVRQKKRKFPEPICIDPYSKAVATFNTYMNPGRSIVIKEGDYNWEGMSGFRETGGPYYL